MNDCWIKLYRKIQDWEWYTDSHMVHLFIHFLLNANTVDRDWKGRTIKRGQLVTGRAKLSADTGITERTIRTCIQRLVSSRQIEIETTNKFSIITVCNYETYDADDIINDQQTTNKRPAKRQQTTSKTASIIETYNADDIINDQQNTNKTTTPKEYNNIISSSLHSEDICLSGNEFPTPKQKMKTKPKTATLRDTFDKRKHTFGTTLIPYVERYGKEMIREFFNYWSEPNRTRTKMRMELERTWDVARRLAYWANHDKNFNSKSNEKNRQDANDKRRGYDAVPHSAEDYEKDF